MFFLPFLVVIMRGQRTGPLGKSNIKNVKLTNEVYINKYRRMHLHNSRLCTKGGMVAIVTSAKCTRPSVARAVFTRVTSLPCRSRYTRRFVSKLVEKDALRASA